MSLLCGVMGVVFATTSGAVLESEGIWSAAPLFVPSVIFMVLSTVDWP